MTRRKQLTSHENSTVLAFTGESTNQPLDLILTKYHVNKDNTEKGKGKKES